MRQHYVHVIALTGFLVFVFLWKSHFFLRLYAVGDIEENDAFQRQNFEMEPALGERNILFVETRCTLSPNGANGSGLLLTNRQACAIESAAKMNTDAKVYVLFTCPMNGGIAASAPYVKELFTYPNVKIWQLAVPAFLQGTSLQDWDFKGHVEQSKWPVEHSSYVLRYVSLLKYGGTYLDLDIIIRKPLDVLGTNYLGKEAPDLLSACVLSLASDGIGRRVSEMCIDEILADFSGEGQNHNGPDLVTKVFKKLCGVGTVAEMTADKCQGLTVLPQVTFAPLDYWSWGGLFTTVYIDEIMGKMNTSFGVHTWSSQSRDHDFNLMVTQPFSLLALLFCPKVHDSSDRLI